QGDLRHGLFAVSVIGELLCGKSASTSEIGARRFSETGKSRSEQMFSGSEPKSGRSIHPRRCGLCRVSACKCPSRIWRAKSLVASLMPRLDRQPRTVNDWSVSLSGVFEGRTVLQALLRRAGQNQLVVVQLEL